MHANGRNLIPKVPSPSSIKIIGLLLVVTFITSVLPKLILANRIQKLLPKLINPCQSAFIKGRSIMDTVLLMQELVRGSQVCCTIGFDESL